MGLTAQSIPCRRLSYMGICNVHSVLQLLQQKTCSKGTNSCTRTSSVPDRSKQAYLHVLELVVAATTGEGVGDGGDTLAPEVQGAEDDEDCGQQHHDDDCRNGSITQARPS